ncbi:NAD(P)/FAD-dependent oxidoreductase [Aquabacterium sp.]|uniref:NAD(P)/FAD-dependent oxidoreductase n=1 Tax=Aquabacterium sp. TaxID=1872578 RepID=UPI00198B6DC1|nr:NAD(P)/FAD-dependent oxidoreductase [Aquabacterium sp.]MBC7700919.1 NAD(P)/FAD-dependent oxidoreductase [Aquabacterium sp.]
MHDVIVVGARCAGAATALLLARQGHKVLIIDQDRFPSDMRLSTHLVWHAGADLLQKWGLLDAVRASLCPTLTEFSLDLGELVLKGTPPNAQVGAAFAPKRIVLDQILLDAAVAAGAELREGVLFDDVLRDGERVVGITAKNSDGSVMTEQARWVVGADGRHSRVARSVGSTAYHEFPKEAGSLNTFAYFSGVPLKGVEFISRPQRMAYAWGTNDDQVLSGIILPGTSPRVARQDTEAHFFAAMEAMSPDLAARLRAGKREEDWISTGVSTFCRHPVGPGWSLVGDAGLTVDPITAAGITNALRDADLLAELLHQGLSGQGDLEETVAAYAPRRDAVSVPLHLFSQDMARLAPPTDEVIQLFTSLAHNQAQADRYFGVFGQTVSPTDFFSPENLQKIANSEQSAAVSA